MKESTTITKAISGDTVYEGNDIKLYMQTSTETDTCIEIPITIVNNGTVDYILNLDYIETDRYVTNTSSNYYLMLEQLSTTR